MKFFTSLLTSLYCSNLWAQIISDTTSLEVDISLQRLIYTIAFCLVVLLITIFSFLIFLPPWEKD